MSWVGGPYFQGVFKKLWVVFEGSGERLEIPFVMTQHCREICALLPPSLQGKRDEKLSSALSITWLLSVIFTRLMHCARSLHCCANKTLITMIRLTCTRTEDESLGFSWERKVRVCQLPARSKDCWGSFQRLQGRECSSGLMAIKAEDGCACPLICWTHCSPYPRFMLLLCCILCKRNWKKSSVTKGFVRQQALEEKGEKKRVRLFFLLLCRQGQQWLRPPPSTPDVRVPLGLDLGEPGGGRLPKQLGLALSWPPCRLGWSCCVRPPVSPPAPVPGSAGSWLWGLLLSQKPTAVKPQLLAFCWGFPLEVWNNLLPTPSTFSSTFQQRICFSFKVYFS